MKRLPRCFPLAGLGLLTLAGCATDHPRIVQSPLPLGSEVDQLMMQQEMNAEPAKFIVFMHEFERNGLTRDGLARGWRLNEFGEDHLKQIAAGLKRGVEFPVVVERSQTSARPGTEHQYPVHYHEDLDQRRRMIVVAALERMGVVQADQRVVVAPSFAAGLSGVEAVQAYNRGFNISGGGTGNGGGQGGNGGGGGSGGGGSAFSQ